MYFNNHINSFMKLSITSGITPPSSYYLWHYHFNFTIALSNSLIPTRWALGLHLYFTDDLRVFFIPNCIELKLSNLIDITTRLSTRQWLIYIMRTQKLHSSIFFDWSLLRYSWILYNAMNYDYESAYIIGNRLLIEAYSHTATTTVKIRR